MKQFCVLYFILCTIHSLSSQTKEYRFKHLSTSEGLSQSSVITIDQDHFGQIWLGTRDGLNRYDGHSFSVFRNSEEDSLSISSNDILDIDEDESGNIWVGTYYGLNLYNPKKNEFKRFYHSENNSIPSNTIWGVCVTKDGKVWVATSNGLAIYHPENKKFTIFQNTNNRHNLRNNLIISILETQDGKIWLGTATGITIVSKIAGEEYHFESKGPDFFVQDMVQDSDGNVWVATKKDGLYTYEHSSGEFLPFTRAGFDKIHKDIRSLTFDMEGTLWLGTYEGVNQIFKHGEVTKIEAQPYDQKSLSRNTIKSVFLDKKGSVWIGAYYGGINIWDSANSNFNNYTQNTGSNSLNYDVVSSIETDTLNYIYFGTEGGGITVLDHKSQTASFLTLENTKDFPSNNIKSLYYGATNRLWIGTFNAGISVYDLQKKKIIPHLITPQLKEYLQGTGVYAIKSETKNIIWLGSFGKGLLRYDLEKQQFKSFLNNPNDSASISGNSIRTLLIDHTNNLWIGTERGLNRVNLNSDIFQNFKVEHFLFDREKRAGEDIQCLFEDSNGTIWVGTKYKGLFAYKDKGLIQREIIASNVKIASIHGIIEDDKGHLWLSSNQGIVKYHLQSKEAILYNQKDGMISNEFNNNASLYLNSRIYFGGPAGASSFNPEEITKNSYAPQVLLTDFKIQNTSVDFRNEKAPIHQNIAYTEQLELSYDKANFSISYAIPNFINSSNNQYKYRLLGLEKEWNLSSNTEANYNIQQSGNYVFEVKGANNDGVWNEQATRLQIHVKPAPWKSTWAFIAYALLIVASLYGLATIINSKTKLKHELELEHLERERNNEIHRAKLEFFTNISHEFRTPLTLISGPLQQLLENYKGSSVMYKKLLVMESNAKHLLQLISRLMDFRKLENNQFELEVAEGNIVKFLKEIYFSFSEFAKGGGYQYKFSASSETILVYYDRNKLEQVFYNLISNAFRYTPKNGMVKISITETAAAIIIQVEDSGIGIPEEYEHKIFNRFFEIPHRNNSRSNHHSGTGIGLSIAKNIVQLHKGEISIQPKTEKGTIFSVSLPLGRKHIREDQILKDFKFSDDLTWYKSQLENSIPETSDTLENLVVDKEKQTILVVEDNHPLRTFMRELLKMEYTILEAGNGKEAMKKALHSVPDLIISDVMMPEMVGTELCAQIKENLKTSHIPVILLTSRTSLIYKFEGLESGADDYISKPFNIKEFRLRIKNIMESTKRLKAKFSDRDNFTPSDITVSSLDEKLLEKALFIVEENIANEQFDIPSFSSELGVSRTLLFTKIKAWTNFTPNEFIHEVRMKRALQLLEQDKLNISQISYEVGFKNPKYFSKCFQKKYGQTPSQYMETFSRHF
tara:strand:- start:10406 stop:14485 length:4080 start_codon:yes stop_codon:yes gene_type:complete